MSETLKSVPAVRRKRLASALLAIPSSVHLHLSRRTNTELYLVARTLIVALTAIVPTIVAIVIISRTMLSVPVLMAPLRVPEEFEKLGYSAESATQRLLDEIATLNKISVASKPKTEVGDTNFLEEVASIQLASGSMDIGSLQSLVSRFFGRKVIQLSGEVTIRKQNDTAIARLRLRRSPNRDVLIDVESTNGPDDLFVKGAMNLLERIDPEIAAGIYFREYGDIETAKRLLSVALASPDPTTRKYANNLKSYILATQGRIDEALAASDQARSFGGDAYPSDNSKAFALIYANRLDEALAMAQTNAERFPDEPGVYSVLGLVQQRMGRNAEAISSYRRAIELNPLFGPVYRRLAVTLRLNGDTDGATEVLVQALSKLPSNPGLLYDYAEDLRKRNQLQAASQTIRRAYLIYPDNWFILVSLAEIEFAIGHNAEAERATGVVHSRLADGDSPPASLKARVDEIVRRSANRH
jgi:tetratricopeptide (TPR) repeat protein